MGKTESLFYGACTIDNYGTIMEVDRFVAEALDAKADAIIGRDIISFFPDYSLDELYLRNEQYSIRLLQSRGMIALTTFDILDGKVYFKIVLMHMDSLHQLFQQIDDSKFADEAVRLLTPELLTPSGMQLMSEHFAANGVVITDSKEMKELFGLMERTAPTSAVLMLRGETGVGKSMFARMIHNMSKRKDGPFIEVDCGTINDNLIESELFGYEKGAFTGADTKGHAGMIELADGGTLFLDEITEIPFKLQQKLLQAIQEKKVCRVGSNRFSDVDFRLISATNRDIEMLVEQNRFRKDLYYRINVIPMHIPPLRSRESDIIALTMYFMRMNNEKYSTIKSFSKEAMQALCRYDWPGNVRELENFVERMILTSTGAVIEKDELPIALLEHDMRTVKEDGSLRCMMEAYERKIILDAYSKYQTSVSVSKALSISQTSAAQKIRKYRFSEQAQSAGAENR
jgi:transcriptional regulator with PAS, ATPase and Fis domain